MPNVKISQLTPVSYTTGSEFFLVIQNGVSKKIALNGLFTNLTSDKDFEFNVKNNDFKVINYIQESKTIASATYSSGVATYTCNGHGLRYNDVVTITGFTTTGFNIANGVVVLVDSSTFKINISDPGVLTASGTMGAFSAPAKSLIHIAGSSTNKVGIRNENPLQELHIAGSLQIGHTPTTITDNTNIPAPTPGVFITPYNILHSNSINDNISVSHDTDTTLISTISSDNQTFILADGIDGQNKTVVLYKNAGNKVIKLSTNVNKSVGFTSITFNKVGSSVNLRYLNNKWYIIGFFDVTPS